MPLTIRIVVPEAKASLIAMPTMSATAQSFEGTGVVWRVFREGSQTRTGREAIHIGPALTYPKSGPQLEERE